MADFRAPTSSVAEDSLLPYSSIVRASGPCQLSLIAGINDHSLYLSCGWTWPCASNDSDPLRRVKAVAPHIPSPVILFLTQVMLAMWCLGRFGLSIGFDLSDGGRADHRC